MQHAYYYGQTDPSVYNSPWPPVQDGHSHVHTPSIPATSQPQTMTYIAHQSPVDSQQGYDAASAPSYATTLQNFDVGSFGLGHDVHSQQQQHQVRKSPSNMYFEDASMHLKMQSLPILNSLVSSPVWFVFFVRQMLHLPSHLAALLPPNHGDRAFRTLLSRWHSTRLSVLGAMV